MAINRNVQNPILQFASRVLETDSYLVEEIVLNNNRQAAEELIERHYKSVFKQIAYKVSDQELAMELTQETFISVLRSLHQFDSAKASFKTWVMRIASNKVIDYRRSRQNQEFFMTDILDGIDVEDSSNIEDMVVDRLTGEKAEEVLALEDEQTRTIFRMKAQEEYTFSEISRKLDLTESTVKNRYYAVIKKMRKELKGYE